MADQMPEAAVRHNSAFFLRFLHPVFADISHTKRQRFQHHVYGMIFSYGDQCYLIAGQFSFRSPAQSFGDLGLYFVQIVF